jgi:sensor histidine kinase YesM
MRILYHIGFWLGFILLFAYQNPNSALEDYLPWLWVLLNAALVVYTNIYYLLPRFFFRKKYGFFILFLMLTIAIGSYTTGLGLTSEHSFFKSDYIQHVINLTVFVVITSSLKFYREYQQKQAHLIKVENEQLKTELKLLKAQVNPHFLFNTLSNLYGLIIQSKNHQAGDITLKLSDLMRYLLQSSKAEKVKLSKEVQFIEDYLDLEKIRLTQNADIQFTVSGTETEVLIAPLLFIPLIENAFKHGLQSLTKNGYAHFTLAKQGDEIFFEAKNSIGKNLDKVLSGTGLENLRKRLELIYPQKHILEVEKNELDFKVSLQISI